MAPQGVSRTDEALVVHTAVLPLFSRSALLDPDNVGPFSMEGLL